MNEIRPCPFCGGKAVCIDRTIPDKSKPRFSILCDSCKAATCWIDTEEHAIEAWNRRKEEDELRSRLADALDVAENFKQTLNSMLDAAAFSANMAKGGGRP